MRNRAVVLIGLMAVAMAAHPAGAAELGDPAPQLQVTEWVRGGPINLAAGKGKNIYVIEFWATWCLPCRESIPHLTEIQKKYRDRGVIVAGIAAEDAADVKRYVANMGERMAYAVGVDDGDKTSIAFLRAYGAEGIPHAFIVDKSGSVVWHGHPMDRLEDALDRVLAGTMDPKLEAEMRELLPLWAMEYMVLAKYGRDTAEADRVGEYLVAHGALMPDLLNRFVPYFFSQEGLAYRNTAFVARVAKVAYDAAPGDAHTAELYARALFENGQAAEAAALVKEVLPAAIGDSQLRSRLDAALEKYEAAAAG